jgi:O-antigen/teichoic acid export membrane protein
MAARNFLALLTGEVGYTLLRFVAIVYLARTVGVSGFGLISFALAVVAYFMLLTNLGLNEYGVREVARDREAVAQHSEVITAIRLAMAVVSFGLLALCLWLLGTSQQERVVAIVFGLLLFPFAGSLEWVFRAMERMSHVGIARTLSSFCYLVLILAVVRGPDHLLLVGLFAVAGEVAATAYLYVVYRRSYGPLRIRLDWATWGRWLRPALPIGLAIGMYTTIHQLDVVLLGVFKGTGPVGLYSAAGKVINLLYMLGIVYVSALYPQLVRKFQQSTSELRQFLVSASKVILVAILPVGLVGTAFARPILLKLYGPAYGEATIAFQLLLWSLLFFLLAHLLSYTLVACNRQNLYFGLIALGAAVNLVLNLVLIGPFSIAGAAVAKLASQVTILGGAYFVMHSRLGFTLRQEALRILASGLVMVLGGLSLLWAPQVVMWTVSLGLYLLALLLLKAVTPQEFAWSRRWIVKLVGG